MTDRKETLPGVLESAALRFPDRPVYAFKGVRVSYSEFLEKTRRVAGCLLSLGVESGDRIVFFSENRPEYIELLFAAAMLNATLVPINTRYGSDDLRVALDSVDPKLVFHSTSFRKQNFSDLLARAVELPEPGANGAKTGSPSYRTISLDPLETGDTYQALVTEAEPLKASRATDDAVALMIFTSGSSGVPKPVMHAQGPMIRHMLRLADWMDVTEQDSVLSYLSYFHVFGGIITVLVPIVSGAKIAILEAFDVDESLKVAEQERCSVIFSVFIAWRAWLEHPDFASFDLSAVRTGTFAVTNEAELETAERVWDTFGPMLSLFGMTETCGMSHMTRPEDSRSLVMTSSGIPVPGVEVEIRDPETGSPCATGEPGEICVRGEAITQGYFRMPEQTAKAIDSDGWLRTGDLGRVDGSDYLYYVARIGDRIRSGGENIDPGEVEAFIARHEGVSSCKVIGHPDDRLGQIPIAFVVARGTAQLDESAILEFCKGRLANFKIPKRVLMLDELPGYDAKVSAYKLKQLAAQLLLEA